MHIYPVYVYPVHVYAMNAINTVRTHAQTHAHSYAYVQNGKGVFDHTKEIKDEEKRAAVLALMAEYSVLCAVATGKADLVAAAVAKGCTVNETDQVDRYACMCMFVLFAVFMYTYIEREFFFLSSSLFSPSSLTLKHTHIRTQEGNSCLHIAAAKGSNEILRILLSAGAKVSAKNKWCKTAYDVATNDEVKAALRQHGARHSLFYAVEQGMLELVADLIKEGANVNEKNLVSLNRVLSAYA